MTDCILNHIITTQPDNMVPAVILILVIASHYCQLQIVAHVLDKYQLEYLSEEQKENVFKMAAVASGDQLDIVELLMEKGFFLTDLMGPLVLACMVGRPKAVKFLLKAGADVNANKGDYPPLHVAAYASSVQCSACSNKGAVGGRS